ncbi:MAG: hypothetical protein IJJ88_06360 [Oscillospiraceae bacterium]|nr:hypothetical protein [Oscillospiraceae bacterium]
MNAKMDTKKCRVLSVGHAGTLAGENAGDTDSLLSIVEQVTKEDRIRGSADDYHNLAVTFTREYDDYVSGFEIVVKGLQYYPNNVDLLADAIFYGSNAGKSAECETYLSELEAIPTVFWNWRAYSFSIDYLLQKVDWGEQLTPEDLLHLTDKALRYAQFEQVALSGEAEVERGYLAEHKIRSVRERYYRLMAKSQNSEKDSEKYIVQAEEEREAAEEVLKRAINDGGFAATGCCLKLADMYFESKKYEDTIVVCRKALSSPQSQPSARLGYFLYLMAMSEDALLYEKNLLGDKDRVQDCYRDYVGAFRRNSGSRTYRDNILDRLAILEARSGIPAPSFEVKPATFG